MVTMPINGAPLKIKNTKINTITNEDVNFYIGKYIYMMGVGSMQDAAKALYKEIPHNSLFMIMVVADTHFIMSGLRHPILDYGYFTCQDYFGNTCAFRESEGVIVPM
ncbi:hypothetical protein MKA58_09490 [[Clostridium] innocuum]|nr:hypothetical protein [[Clostridium] innocuum]